MLTPRSNFHYSKIPAPRTVGHIVGLSTADSQRKCIASNYLLCDSVPPYSLGIHAAYVRFLDNHQNVCVRAHIPHLTNCFLLV